MRRCSLRGGEREWASKVLPRYQRRLPELNEAITGAYLAGTNTRCIKGALRPLLKAAPLSRSAVSRAVGTLKGSLDAWRSRSLEEHEVVYLYLDAIALRVRTAGKVVSSPVLVAVAVLANGQKQLLSLEMCGSESNEAWKGFLDDLVSCKLAAPMLCVIDGNAGLRRAVQLVWPESAVQRCVKTQGSLPTEDAAIVLLFSLVASGQIRLRKLGGFEKIASMLNTTTRRAA